MPKYSERKWRIDVLPTTAERILGSVGGIVAGLFCGVLVYANLDRSTEYPIVQAALNGTFFVLMCLSFRIAFRATFGKPSLPSRKAQLGLFCFVAIFSVVGFVSGLVFFELNILLLSTIGASWSYHNLRRLYS